MKKRFVTRTIVFDELEVTVYNKANEALEVYELSLRQMSEKDRVKEIEERFSNFKVVNINVKNTDQVLMKLSESKFIEECKKEAENYQEDYSTEE